MLWCGSPDILILDDSASALDYATDADLRMAIRRMENPPTTFIVSQRAASVRYADEILVLDDGVLAGKGTHDELLESCPVYQEIYYSQFPGRRRCRNGIIRWQFCGKVLRRIRRYWVGWSRRCCWRRCTWCMSSVYPHSGGKGH